MRKNKACDSPLETLAMTRMTQQTFIDQEKWLIKYMRASKNVCLIAHDEGWFARMGNNFQDGRKYEGLSLLTTPYHLQNLHLLRYTFVTVTHYFQIHRLIPQHTKQWPEAKAEQIKLSAFLWSLVSYSLWDISEPQKAVFGRPQFIQLFGRHLKSSELLIILD